MLIVRIKSYYQNKSELLGLERPDGSENEGQMLEFGAVTFSFVKKER